MSSMLLVSDTTADETRVMLYSGNKSWNALISCKKNKFKIKVRTKYIFSDTK